MKRLFLFALALIAFASCSKDDAIENESIEGKEYIVNLGFSGEIEVSHSPLSKAGTNDLYGVQVYTMDTEKNRYTPYAYGLFDNVADMEIVLTGGNKYFFMASMVENGKNCIDTYNGDYSAPFSINNTSTPLENKFIYSGDKEMSSLNNGKANLKGYTETFYRPNIVRYYGDVSDFTPTEGKSVTINMKKVVFGAKFIVPELSEGSVNINIPDAPEMVITYPNTEIEDIFTFANGNAQYGDWDDDDFQENLEIYITWTKADGTVVPVSNPIIEFIRNEMTTVTIKLKKDDGLSTDIDMNLVNEGIKPGANITVNAQ